MICMIKDVFLKRQIMFILSGKSCSITFLLRPDAFEVFQHGFRLLSAFCSVVF